jgi:hypothetical protein
MFRFPTVCLFLVTVAGLVPAALRGEDTPIRAAVADQDAIDGAFADAVALAQKRTVKIFGAAIGRSPGYGTA